MDPSKSTCCSCTCENAASGLDQAEINRGDICTSGLDVCKTPRDGLHRHRRGGGERRKTERQRKKERERERDQHYKCMYMHRHAQLYVQFENARSSCVLPRRLRQSQCSFGVKESQDFACSARANIKDEIGCDLSLDDTRRESMSSEDIIFHRTS